MDSKTWLAHFTAAPESVRNYLLDKRSIQDEHTAQKALAYENDAWDRVMDVVWETVFAQMPRQDFKNVIKRLAGDRKPEDVEKAVLFHVVLPMADLVEWDVEGRLQELGVSLVDIQNVPRISLRPVSYGAAVRRIVAQAKISILAEELFRRTREIFVSYLKGVRTIEQVREILSRNQSEGGIGLSPAQVAAFVDTMLAFLTTTQVLSEQEYADWMVNEEREAGARRAQIMQATAAVPTEGEEGAPIARTVAPTTVVDQAVESTMQRVGLSLDGYLMRRLQNAISTRLRDVRNGIQTKALLTRETRVGGVGLSVEEAERVAGIIEQAYQTYHEQIEAEERKEIEAMKTEQLAKTEERKRRESEEHAKWFQEKVHGLRAEDVFVTRQDAQPEGSKKTEGNPSLGFLNASVESPVRPSIDGITPPPARLVGLADELVKMSIADFRRLSKNPDEAAAKIQQKLDTLKAESFDRWTEGVEAWRRSPLQRQYLRLVAESFSSGQPVAQLVDEKRVEDPSLPTAAELGAIIALNSHLQF